MREGGWGVWRVWGVSVVSCQLLQHQRRRLAKVAFVRFMFKKQSLDATGHVTCKSRDAGKAVGVGQLTHPVTSEDLCFKKNSETVWKSCNVADFNREPGNF